MPFVATWMDLEIIIRSEVNQTEKYDISNRWNLIKTIQKNLFTKQKQTQRFQNQTYGYQTGKARGKDGLGGWEWHRHTTVNKINR